MEPQSFSRKEVERSFRKFGYIVNDLFSCPFQTWGNEFTHLITHCEQDPVMRVVTEPLRTNTNVNAEKWLADSLQSVQSMVGSGDYELPYDDDDRTALLYQFFIMIENGKVNVNSFCINFYGKTRFQEAFATFNETLVQKFVRVVNDRLDEILQDIGGQQKIPREAIVAFHVHDQSVTVHGNIQGSNVAASGSTLSGSSAEYTNNEELASALTALGPLVTDITESQRASVSQALQLLVQATHDSSISREVVGEATRTIAVNSSTMRQRLVQIVEKVGVALASSAIIQGIKMACGVP